jgi:AcrR family transcriptional regulator
MLETVVTSKPQTRRLGRPPATDGAETRQRLLTIALQEFAERGYSDATLKEIAVKAGLTTGAVYHYFSSKSELFIAVAEYTLVELTTVYVEHDATAKTLVERLDGAFEAIAILNERIPELAPFVASLETDALRYPELQEISARMSQERDSFYERIVAEAVASGEIGSDVNPQSVLDLLYVIRAGLVRFAIKTGDAKRHRALILGLERLFEGNLFTSPVSVEQAD